MSSTAIPGNRALRARRAFFTPLTRLLNPTIRRIAGRPGVLLLGLVSHRGRLSGRAYATPVGVGSSADEFLIPLTFGSASEWCRNVLDTGACSITWTPGPGRRVDDRRNAPAFAGQDSPRPDHLQLAGAF